MVIFPIVARECQPIQEEKKNSEMGHLVNPGYELMNNEPLSRLVFLTHILGLEDTTVPFGVFFLF